jgi:hypothetical protein
MGAKDDSRKGQFLTYLIGGGTCVYAVALLGSCTYNGMWDDDNYWRNFQLGRQATIHALAVSIIVLAIVAALTVIGAVAMRFMSPDARIARLVFYITSFIIGLALLALEAVALAWTTHGDAHVSSEYDYYNTSSPFKEYYDKYGSPNPSTFGSLDDPVISNFDQLLADQNFTTSVPYKELDWSEYYQEYANTSQPSPNNSAMITPCVFDWNALAQTPLKFMGGDPCMFTIADEDALACIGGWTGTNFQRFWCYASRKYLDDQERNKDGGPPEQQHRDITAQIGRWAVDSLSAFYRHNTYMIGWLAVSLVISVIAVTLDDIFLVPKQTPKPESETAVKNESSPN